MQAPECDLCLHADAHVLVNAAHPNAVSSMQKLPCDYVHLKMLDLLSRPCVGLQSVGQFVLLFLRPRTAESNLHTLAILL